MKTLYLLIILTFTTALTNGQGVAISQLPGITDSLHQADVIPIVHNGTTRKVTVQQLQTQITGLPVTTVSSLVVGSTAMFNGNVSFHSLPNLSSFHLTRLAVSDSGNLSYQPGVVASKFDSGVVNKADTVLSVTILVSGTYKVGGYVNIIADSVDVLERVIKYTDENGTAQTLTSLPITSSPGMVPFNDLPIRPQVGTSVACYIILYATGGHVTYNADAFVEFIHQ